MLYLNKKIEKMKFKKLYLQTKNGIGLGGAYFDEDKKRIIRYKATTSKNCKFWKKQANRRVRYYSNDLSPKCSVKKIFPLVNILY